VSPSGAEAKRIGEEIEVYCKKCWGELGLNRASVALKKSAEPSEAAAYEEPAQEPIAEEPAAEYAAEAASEEAPAE